MVKSGAQSTIISRDFLHQIATAMCKAGREGPELLVPSAKLYGRSGKDKSELTVTAEVIVMLELDNHREMVPVFVQPGRDIPCLLGMNLRHLGIQFLRGNQLHQRK